MDTSQARQRKIYTLIGDGESQEGSIWEGRYLVQNSDWIILPL